MINMQQKQEAALNVLLQVAADDTSPNSSIPGNHLLQLMPAIRQSHRHQHHRGQTATGRPDGIDSGGVVGIINSHGHHSQRQQIAMAENTSMRQCNLLPPGHHAHHHPHHPHHRRMEPTTTTMHQQQIMSAVTSATTSTTTSKSRHTDLDAYSFPAQYGKQFKNKTMFQRIFNRPQSSTLPSNAIADKPSDSTSALDPKVKVKGNKLIIQNIKDSY